MSTNATYGYPSSTTQESGCRPASYPIGNILIVMGVAGLILTALVVAGHFYPSTNVIGHVWKTFDYAGLYITLGCGVLATSTGFAVRCCCVAKPNYVYTGTDSSVYATASNTPLPLPTSTHLPPPITIASTTVVPLPPLSPPPMPPHPTQTPQAHSVVTSSSTPLPPQPTVYPTPHPIPTPVNIPMPPLPTQTPQAHGVAIPFPTQLPLPPQKGTNPTPHPMPANAPQTSQTRPFSTHSANVPPAMRLPQPPSTHKLHSVSTFYTQTPSIPPTHPTQSVNTSILRPASNQTISSRPMSTPSHTQNTQKSVYQASKEKSQTGLFAHWDKMPSPANLPAPILSTTQSPVHQATPSYPLPHLPQKPPRPITHYSALPTPKQN